VQGSTLIQPRLWGIDLPRRLTPPSQICGADFSHKRTGKAVRSITADQIFYTKGAKIAKKRQWVISIFDGIGCATCRHDVFSGLHCDLGDLCVNRIESALQAQIRSEHK
jgi:hypothetical protein